MYRRLEQSPTPPEKFEFPLAGKLSPDNRWVVMANLVPWSEFEEEYAQNFSTEMGAPAKPFRMALGALIIKERLGVSDRETVEQIRENPYLQYFIGLEAYSNEAPFEASMLVHFRERIGVELVKQITKRMVMKIEEMVVNPAEKKSEEKREEEIRDLDFDKASFRVGLLLLQRDCLAGMLFLCKSLSKKKNQGKLILDATCAPADIRYPQDLGILNEAREKTEEIIDSLYEPIKDQLNEKPRTYREKARKDYLDVAKKRRPRQTKKKSHIERRRIEVAPIG